MNVILRLPGTFMLPTEVATRVFELLAPYQHQAVDTGWRSDPEGWKFHKPGAGEARLRIDSLTDAEVTLVNMNSEAQAK
jgi:hypothetical protein